MRKLALVACLLTVCITAASALIRHWQAGLDCARWPACQRLFDESSGADAAADGRSATAGAPRAGVAEGGSAVTEPPAAIQVARLAHRASASTVGLMVALVALFGWSGFTGGQRAAAAVALADTLFLAWLGRYTPHDLPLVTLGNLAGGMLLAGALAWVAAARGSGPACHRRLGGGTPPRRPGRAIVALVLLATLLFTGSLTGVRDAVDACPQLLCVEGARVAASAFDPSVAGGAGPAEQLGMHLVHRSLAVAFALAAVVTAIPCLRAADTRLRTLAALLFLLLAAQFSFGLATATGILPLLSATLHNVGAMLIAAVLAAVAAAPPAGAAERPLRAPPDRGRLAGT